MGTVLKNLVNGLSRQWTLLGKYWRVCTKGKNNYTAFMRGYLSEYRIFKMRLCNYLRSASYQIVLQLRKQDKQ